MAEKEARREKKKWRTKNRKKEMRSEGTGRG